MHPWEKELMAHRGTMPGFAQMRERMHAQLSAKLRRAISGEADSEHVLRLFLSLAYAYEIAPNVDFKAALRTVFHAMADLSEEAALGKMFVEQLLRI